MGIFSSVVQSKLISMTAVLHDVGPTEAVLCDDCGN